MVVLVVLATLIAAVLTVLRIASSLVSRVVSRVVSRPLIRHVRTLGIGMPRASVHVALIIRPSLLRVDHVVGGICVVGVVVAIVGTWAGITVVDVSISIAIPVAISVIIAISISIAIRP